MCLAIPGKIVEITGETSDTFRSGKVSFGGILKEINLSLVPDATINNYVLVHVGVAITIVDEVEAKKTFDYLERINELNELNES